MHETEVHLGGLAIAHFQFLGALTSQERMSVKEFKRSIQEWVNELPQEHRHVLTPPLTEGEVKSIYRFIEEGKTKVRIVKCDNGERYIAADRP